MQKRYTLSNARAEAIAIEAGLPVTIARKWCLAAWEEEGHQEWLDTAPTGEIATWLEALTEEEAPEIAPHWHPFCLQGSSEGR